MLRTLLFAATLACLPAVAADAPPPAKPAPAAPATPWFGTIQTPYGPMLMQQALPPPYRDYQMNRILKPEEKKRWLQMAMPILPPRQSAGAKKVSPGSK